ncbi:transcription factor TFIIIB complex subunit bdp1 [Rhizophagus clarus]|nr:transcription factor TFIIIB complex subunit bdp1 [Rhizophagus clarus]
MFKNSKSLLRSKAGKSKGTIIDVPGKSLEPTPITIVQPSNSQESSGGNKSTQLETNPDAIVVNYEGNTIDVVSQAPQDIMMDVSPSVLPAKTRSSEKRSTINRTAINADNMMNKSSGDGIQKKSLQKFPTSPKIILSFTNDSLVESSSSSGVTGIIESQNASENTTSQHIEESDVTIEDSSVKTRQRKTAIMNKKRARSNNDDEQSEDSTVATSSSSKQSKRHKRSSSITSITSSTNTDGSSTKSNSTAGRKRRSKSRKPRTTTRKQQSSKSRVKPWEDDPEDENPLDDSIVKMAELCKDLKRGRKSNTYKELEYAKYQKSQQKRRQRAAANNIRDDDQMNVGDGETPISQQLGDEDNELVQDQNIPGDNQNEQNEQYEQYEIEQNEEFNNDGSENYDEYYENREWEQEGYYDEDGNWIQYENYENEEFQQDYEMEEVEDENTQQDENNENHKPTLMKRRVFSSRGSRFVNADGQYTVREEQDSRPRIYENDEGMEVVEEDKFSHIVNSFTYSKKPRKNERWTIDDTELFFKALSRWGTDFEIISRKIFDNRKSRDQVKNKYKRERKINPLRVYKALDTRIPIEPEELEIISRYTEELATIQADNDIQDETTEVNQDDIVDDIEGGSTEENREAFDLI